MIKQLAKPKAGSAETEKIPNKAGGGKRWWIFLLIATAAVILAQFKKENPESNIPSDEELLEALPNQARQAFKERYGLPHDDERDCELYYLLANTTMQRPCLKCPVWCGDAAQPQILVLKDEIYYIGKTCRQGGEREKEHRALMTAFQLRYQWIKRGTEGYISRAEQLHLKTYYTRPESVKEGCHLFLPPGNTIGMSWEEWKKLPKGFN